VIIALLRKIRRFLKRASSADDAMALNHTAAEGSARDATSLLDSTRISHAQVKPTAISVRAMPGAGRSRSGCWICFDMNIAVIAGGALANWRAICRRGRSGPYCRDLAEVTHWISVVKITPECRRRFPQSAPMNGRVASPMADGLPLRALARCGKYAS